MSGDQVALATGGRAYTPRLRTRSATEIFNSDSGSSSDSITAPAAPSVPPPSSLSHSNKILLASNGHVNAWQKLPEKSLWEYFVKIRTLYFQQQTNLGLDSEAGSVSPLMRRYYAIKEFLFHLYLPDVLRVAESYRFRRMPQSSLVDMDDLIQAATIVAFQLIDKYDPAFGDGRVTFMGYANARDKSAIQGRMTDQLRRLQHFPRPVAELRREFRPKIRQAQSQAGHALTPEEILDVIGWEYKDLLYGPDSLFDSGVFNQSQVSQQGCCHQDRDNWENAILEMPAASQPFSLDRRLIQRENIERILAPIQDVQIRAIVFSYHFTGANFKKIARELRKAYGRRRSQSWVNMKYKEGLRILSEFHGKAQMKNFAE